MLPMSVILELYVDTSLSWSGKIPKELVVGMPQEGSEIWLWYIGYVNMILLETMTMMRRPY
jgi:hypothetical protein